LFRENHTEKLAAVDTDMQNAHPPTIIAFIVGSPRSGTTVLGETLDKHPRIRQWYEPYFVWDRSFRNAPDDERSPFDCMPEVAQQIRRAFYRYGKGRSARVIIDKSPRNSLKIPFIRRVFPDARFIHLLRDGRDVTLSLNKKWVERKQIVNDPSRSEGFNYLNALQKIKWWLGMQGSLENMIRAVWFETHGSLNTLRHYNRMRWNGGVGYGPRFKDWERLMEDVTLLQFNAYQWLKCVEKIQRDLIEVPDANWLEVRYERLITQPEKTLMRIMNFLDISVSHDFFVSVPEFKKTNSGKWKREFTLAQLEEIGAIVGSKLIELGYSKDACWHERSGYGNTTH
jgi:hypothetical protein